MKIAFDCNTPFHLAHGGLEVQIMRTKAALENLGLHVEFLRWWDSEQKPDIIHFFGRANPSHIEFAHGKGIRYVMSDLLTGQGSRTLAKLNFQGALERILRKIIPSTFLANFRWDAYTKADATILLTRWEADIVRILFDPAPECIHVVPNGVEDVFFKLAGHDSERADDLVCTATITERKRVLELAEAAVLARTPLRILGNPYGMDDPYYLRFLALADKHPQFVSYAGAVSNRAELARIYRTARGFVLLSTMESLSLSALEAAASGCPLLLSDLPWARCTFGSDASYCPISDAASTAKALRAFYNEAPSLPTANKPCSWEEVANQLVQIYQKL